MNHARVIEKLKSKGTKFKQKMINYMRCQECLKKGGLGFKG